MSSYGSLNETRAKKVRILVCAYAVAVGAALLNSSTSYRGGYLSTTAILIGLAFIYYYRIKYVNWKYDLGASLTNRKKTTEFYNEYILEELPVIIPTTVIIYNLFYEIDDVSSLFQLSIIYLYKLAVLILLIAALLSEAYRRIKL